jgi:NDP-sugar pyrophosphorylase family protein
MRAVILAGGKGKRLAPYTTILPKPLMPVGEMPILELLIRQLCRAGIERITLAIGQSSALLPAYFGDGAGLGVEIDYSVEREPLGTAGPLGLIAGLDEPFLVMNGDLLTDLDFAAMVATHERRRPSLTVGVYERTTPVDLGVVELSPDGGITAYIEKPTQHFLVSMGVYVVEPSVLRYIPQGVAFDLPTLVSTLLGDGVPVAAHLHDGYWLDIGRPDDFQRAQEEAPRIQALLLEGPPPAAG